MRLKKMGKISHLSEITSRKIKDLLEKDGYLVELINTEIVKDVFASQSFYDVQIFEREDKKCGWWMDEYH